MEILCNLVGILCFYLATCWACSVISLNNYCIKIDQCSSPLKKAAKWYKIKNQSWSCREQIWPFEHAIKTKIDLQLSQWSDMQMCAITEAFYQPINSLKTTAGTVCSPVFLLDKNRSVKPGDSSSSLSCSLSAGKLDKTMQNNAVWCNAKVTH